MPGVAVAVPTCQMILPAGTVIGVVVVVATVVAGAAEVVVAAGSSVVVVTAGSSAVVVVAAGSSVVVVAAGSTVVVVSGSMMIAPSNVRILSDIFSPSIEDTKKKFLSNVTGYSPEAVSGISNVRITTFALSAPVIAASPLDANAYSRVSGLSTMLTPYASEPVDET